MEQKFTRDGRKFSVISELNASQFIVQEIFMENGKEISFGEKIAMNKSELCDSPISSWKESELKQYISKWEREKEETLKKIERERRELNALYKKMYVITKTIQDMCSNLDRHGRMEFIRLLDFLSGNIKWVIEIGYAAPKLISFEELDMVNTENGMPYGMKLFTLFGNVNGDLQYRLNYYGDGSGGGTNYYVFCDYEEAEEKLKELIRNQKNITLELIEASKKYNVELDRCLLEKFYSSRRDYLEKNIKTKHDEIDRDNLLLSEIPKEYLIK